MNRVDAVIIPGSDSEFNISINWIELNPALNTSVLASSGDTTQPANYSRNNRRQKPETGINTMASSSESVAAVEQQAETQFQNSASKELSNVDFKIVNKPPYDVSIPEVDLSFRPRHLVPEVDISPAVWNWNTYNPGKINSHATAWLSWSPF